MKKLRQHFHRGFIGKADVSVLFPCVDESGNIAVRNLLKFVGCCGSRAKVLPLRFG